MCKLESILTHSRPDGTPISSLKRKLWYGSVFKSFEIVIVWSKFAQKWQEILYSISVVCKNSPFIYLNLTFFFSLGIALKLIRVLKSDAGYWHMGDDTYKTRALKSDGWLLAHGWWHLQDIMINRVRRLKMM